MTAPRRATPALAVALCLSLGLSLALGLGTTPTSASAAGDSRQSGDRPWSGFSIAATGRASGAWIGARKVGRRPAQVVYRVDPAAAPRPGALRAPRAVVRLGGGPDRSSGSRTTTARAAWILSKYGTYRDAAQSAAVDAAVLHLLARGRFRLAGRSGSERIAQTGYDERVRGLATTMLRDSRRLSGPYRVLSAQVGDTEVGQAVQVAVGVVVTRSRVPLRSVPVEVGVGAGRWRAAGRTDTDGRVSYDVAGLPAGPHLLGLRIRRVPETRLLVRQPRRARASRVAVAGRKQQLAASVRVVVLATPRVRVEGRGMPRGQRTRGRIILTGAYGRASRPAAVRLHGPFGSRQQATCARKQLRLRRVPVAGDGAVDLPSLKLQQAGFYAWRVDVPGTEYNRPAAACGGTFRVARRTSADR